MHTIRLSMESRKSIFRIETLSEEINPGWAIVFRNCFKDPLVDYLENKEKNRACQLLQGSSTKWLQRSAMQASLYLPLASNDEMIREMIAHVLKQHFEFVNTSYSSAIPYGNEKSNVELYRLSYPLQLAYLFYLRTEDISQFSLLFTSASSRILALWEKELMGAGKKVILEKEFLIEVIQYLEEIFRNITRHAALEEQALTLKKRFVRHAEFASQEEHALFRKGLLVETYREKEKILNLLLGKMKETQYRDTVIDLLFCQLLLNYFKV